MEQDEVLREIEQLNKEIKADIMMTKIRKENFINQLNAGLGKEIKENPNGVKILKKSWKQRLKEKLKKIFTTF